MSVNNGRTAALLEIQMENWVGKDKKVLLRPDLEVFRPAVVNRGAV